MANWILRVGIAVGIVVVIIGATVWLGRNDYLTPNTENQQSQEQRSPQA